MAIWPIYNGMPNGHFRARPERIAHRGAPREFDENTLPGFLRSLERGADAVELDVHLTRDGQVVVHHDLEIATPDGVRVPIREMTEVEAAAIPLPAGGHVPTLAAVMDALGDRAVVYVEIKGEGVGEAAAEVADRHGSRYAFHSFNHDVVLALRSRRPRLRYGFLFDAGCEGLLAAVESAPVADIWVHWSLVDEALVRAVHAADQRVIAWTVNDREMASRFASLGIDGLCTDDVRLLPSGPV